MGLEDKRYTFEEFFDTAGAHNEEYVDIVSILDGDINKQPSNVSYLRGASFSGTIMNVFILRFVGKDSYRSVKLPDSANVREYLINLEIENNPLMIEVLPNLMLLRTS